MARYWAVAFLLAVRSAAAQQQETVSVASFDGAGPAVSVQAPALNHSPKPAHPPAPATPAAPAAPIPSYNPDAVTFNGQAFPSYAFNDRTNPLPLLLDAIRAAKQSLDGAFYELAIPGVANALIAAQRRGVKVRLVLDASQLAAVSPASGSQPVTTFDAAHDRTRIEEQREVQNLAAAGVEIRAISGTGQYGIMHDKFAIFDNAFIAAGSMNWSENSITQDFNNYLFRDDHDLVLGFRLDWNWMWSQASPLGQPLQPLQGQPPKEYTWPLSFKGTMWPKYIFTPGTGVQNTLLAVIHKCQRTIDIAMFSFYAQPIADALLDAKNRGVAVRLVIDVSQAQNSFLTPFLKKNGFDVRLLSGMRGSVGVMHHKFGIFDGEMMETGSFNYSENATYHNFENALFFTGPKDIGGYEDEFLRLYKIGKPL